MNRARLNVKERQENGKFHPNAKGILLKKRKANAAHAGLMRWKKKDLQISVLLVHLQLFVKAVMKEKYYKNLEEGC